jgi:hypothetical protein
MIMKKKILTIGACILLLTGCQKEENVVKNSMSQVFPAPVGKTSSEKEIIPTIKVLNPGMLEASGDGMHGIVSFGDIISDCIGIYSSDGQSTYFSLRSENGTSVAGVFSGDQTGHYLKGSSMTFVTGGKTYAADDKICIHISEYGNIGGKICGTFSGTFRRHDVDLKTGERQVFSVQVNNGAFQVKRLKDQ